MAYKKMGETLKTVFEARYDATPDNVVLRHAWKTDLINKLGDYNQQLKNLNNEAKRKTQTNAAKKKLEKTDLTYNPHKMVQVANFLLEMPFTADLKTDLCNTDLTNADIREKYSEIQVRFALCLETLLTTGGNRASTVANMTIEELKDADRLSDGTLDVSVKNHQTFKSPVTHPSTNLYLCCLTS